MGAIRQFVFGAAVATAIVASVALVRTGGGTSIQPAALADTQAAAPAAHTLTFTGTGTVRVKPDTAQISFTTGGEGATKADAVNAASRAMRSVLAAMKRHGVGRGDLRTSMDAYRDSSRGVYEASDYLEATVRDVDAAGRLLAAGLGAGADSASGPEYSLRDQDRGYAAALRAAMANARTHADAAASLIGAHVTEVESASEPAAGGAVPVYYGAADSLEALRPVPSRHGMQVVSVSVTVVFGYAGG